MAVKPTKPVSPPQALRSVPENFSANSEGWIAYQAGAFPDWIDAISDYVDERADEALAAALAGTLPPLTGKAGQIIRANSTGTAVEFATGPQAQKSLGFHAFDNAFLGAGVTGNLAIGAADFGNTARWLNTQTANGVTLTRVGFGIDANGCTYVDYSVVGTPTTGSHTMDVYVQQSSVTSAASGQVFTASCYAQIIGGTTPADTNTGIRVEMRGQTALAVQTEAFFTDVTRPTVQTLRTLTSTLAAATTAQIICGVVLRVQAGVTANFTVRISGLQFDRGAARLNYLFKALSAAEARTAMGVEPSGQIGWFARNTAPDGWLKANGALVSRTTYAALFAATGTTFGAGDGSTTFNLPDLRGEFLRGWDDGRRVDTGRAFGSAQSDAIRNISGSLSFGAQMAPVQAVSGAFSSGTTNQFMPQQSTANTQGIGIVNFNASGSVPTAGENRPRNIALLACIKF